MLHILHFVQPKEEGLLNVSMVFFVAHTSLQHRHCVDDPGRTNAWERKNNMELHEPPHAPPAPQLVA